MNFIFSEEQEELRRTIRRFLDDRSPATEVRRLMETPEGFDEKVWRQMAGELGLQGLAIPEEYGGQGFTFVELGIVLEEMGRALLCAPFLSSAVLAANAILLAGTDAQRKELVPPIASGETIATFAYSEPSGRWDLAGVECAARAEGDAWVLDGTKDYVLDGASAGLLVVAARTAAGVGLFAVDAAGPGVERTAHATMDLTRKQAQVVLSGAPARAIGEPGPATEEAIERLLDLARVAVAAECVGAGQRCLDMAVDYAKNRYQFGRPIGQFQAIKHKCADVLLEVEGARVALYYALWAAAAGDDDLVRAAPMAKATCADAAFKAASENIQVHGGIGFTWEHDAHLYFRRAKTNELLFGDSASNRELLAGRLGI